MYIVNTGLHPFHIRFDLLAEPQFSAELFDLGGARADFQRQHLFLFFIGVPPFLVEWFSLPHGSIKLRGEPVFGGLQFFGGFDSVFCQKPVLCQIFLKLYRVLQQIPADLLGTAPFGCTAQQINIVEIQRTKTMYLGVLLKTALAGVMLWNRQLLWSVP